MLSAEFWRQWREHHWPLLLIYSLSERHTLEEGRNNWEREKRMTFQLSRHNTPGGCALLSEKLLHMFLMNTNVRSSVLTRLLHWLTLFWSLLPLRCFVYVKVIRNQALSDPLNKKWMLTYFKKLSRPSLTSFILKQNTTLCKNVYRFRLFLIQPLHPKQASASISHVTDSRH